MKRRAQSTLEFTFAMVVIIFLIYGMVRVFRWVGMDLAQRRVAQDKTLINPDWPAAANPNDQYDPSKQLTQDFYRVQPMEAIYHGNITTNEDTPE